MKKLALLLIVLVMSITAFSQRINFTDLSKFNPDKSNGFTSYVSKDSLVFKVGDKLTLKDQSKNNRLKYIYLEESIKDDILPLYLKYLTIDKINVERTNKDQYVTIFYCSNNLQIHGLGNCIVSVEQAIRAKEIIK
jgi:hypothetical protein